MFVVGCGGGSEARSPGSDGGSSTQSEGEGKGAFGASRPPKSIECADFSTCAVTGDGAVRCWGRDKSGELGDGAGADKSRHIGIDLGGKATSVALAAQFGCALLEGKTVKCWGSGRIANDGKAYTSARPT